MVEDTMQQGAEPRGADVMPRPNLAMCPMAKMCKGDDGKARGSRELPVTQKEQIMKTNVGTADRVIRVLAGLVLFSLVFGLESNARWWGLVGLLPLATGLAGWCALYKPFGIDTSRTKHDTPGAPHPST
jgi:hypothetical protein